MYARTCIPRVKNVGLLLKSSFICLNEVSRDWTSTIHLFLPRVSQTERTVNTSPGASAKHDSRAQLKLPLVGSHRALLKPYPVIRAKLRKLPSSFLGAEQVHSYVGRPVLYFQVQTPEIIHDWLTEPHTDWQRVKFTLFTVENLKGPRSSPFVLWHILWIKNNHAKAERRVFLLTVNIMYDKVLDPWNRSWLNWRCETTKTKESTGEYIQHINTDIYIFTANNNKKKNPAD